MSILYDLETVIRDRKAHPTAASYTCRLFDEGLKEIAKKVGEEAIEVIVAASNEGNDRLTEEAADLMYHLLVLLVARGVSWDAVEATLAERRR